MITQSGRYHLTSDLLGEAGKAGIRIQARSVVIDLNGHTVDGQSAGTTGIASQNFQSVEITGGVVRDWTIGGVLLESDPPGPVVSILMQGVTCRDNGGVGAAVSGAGLVSGCVFSGNEQDGLRGLGIRIENSSAFDNRNDGFQLSSGSLYNSSASANDGFGIVAESSVDVSDCRITFNNEGGLLVGGFCRVEGNHFDFNGDLANAPDPIGAAIVAISASTIITNNSATDHQIFVARGIGITPANMTIVNNHVVGGTLTTVSTVTNTVGPTVNAGNVATNTNPHANYLN